MNRDQLIDQIRKARSVIRQLRGSLEQESTPVTFAAVDESYRKIVEAHEEIIYESRGVQK